MGGGVQAAFSVYSPKRWGRRRNAMQTAATHRLRGKKSSLHDAEAVQAPFNPL